MKHTLELTHLDKIFWPEEKYTKGDLLDYYQQVAPYMVPYLLHRPQVLHQFPDGIKGVNFYHKSIEGDLPEFVKTKKIHADSDNRDLHFIVCENEETLMYMANLGTIEIHPWLSTVDQLHHPDFLVIDLDPQDVPFKHVVEVAHTTRKILQNLKIPCFCKTSGKRGLHIFIPIGKQYTYDQSHEYAKQLAKKIHQQTPEWTSLEHDPDKRKGKIYLDYLRNSFGQTVAAPYSVRPVAKAPVSTPLEWDEVTKDLDPTDFTIKTMIKRLEKKGDLWKGVLGKGVELNILLGS